MNPLTPEEEEVLRELEREVEKPSEPAPEGTRFERFIAEPVGMDDEGHFFPIPPPPEP